jgi:hypothetical protein
MFLCIIAEEQFNPLFNYEVNDEIIAVSMSMVNF